MENIVEIKNLKKSFGEVHAVNDISFSVEKGSLFAFLGINGAGKSTTINILCTILEKDGGEVKIAGYDLDKDVEEIKKRIGIVFQNTVLDEKLTVKDNLKTRASYYGLRGKEWKARLDELTDMLDLAPLLQRPFGKLSGGQRRRVDIARGLINYPEILFLDEPTTGLDPKTRQMIWDIINQIRERQQMTVFLTTHYMEEAEKATKVVIIDAGKVIAEDTPNGLKNIYSGNYVKLNIDRRDSIDARLDGDGYAFRYEKDAYYVKLKESVDALDFLKKHGEIATDFEVFKGNMDDVFLNATGKKLEV